MITSKIVFLIEEFNSSGGIKIVTAIANTLAETGLKVGFIAPKYTQQPFYPLNKNIELTFLGSKKFGGKLFYFLHLFFRIMRFRGTLVTPNYRIAVIHKLTLSDKRSPFVFLIQGDDSVSLIKYSSSNKFVKCINSRILKLSKTTISERIFVSNYLMNNSNKKGTLIPNYISEYFLNSQKRSLFKDEFVNIGTVSTLAPNKGFDFYLQCLDEIIGKSEGKTKFRFICATQHPLLSHSKTSHKIDFVSPKNEQEMSNFYQNCDFYISCSISEGFNLPVLEAMASGCIVIATNDGGVTDFIANGKNGYLIETRDARSVSDILNQLIQNKELLFEMQGMAIQKAKQYSREKFNHAYLNFFDKLIRIN